MSDVKEVVPTKEEMVLVLRQEAFELRHGVAMSNFTFATICEALALLLEKQSDSP